MNWSDFLAMGGYARFVWPSFGLTLVLLLVNALAPWLRQRRLLNELRTREFRARQEKSA